MSSDSFSNLSYDELRRLDPIVAKFEMAFTEEKTPAIEDHLNECPESLIRPLFRELLAVELELSGKLRDPQTESQYLHRFPGFAEIIRDIFVVPSREDAAAFASEEVIDGYRIIETVGRGGMGVVYRAKDTQLDRVVALKMILAGEHSSERRHQRFAAEATAAARLQHPNIVSIYSFGNHERRPYLAMELVDGANLKELLRDNPFGPRIAAEFCTVLARAVHYAHENGVIHRDLKPANILVSRSSSGSDSVPTLNQNSEQSKDNSSGASSSMRSDDLTRTSNGLVPKITDFGLARDLASDRDMTATGEILGTAQYMSPEQARGENDVGRASDVYSLGVLLYELLTGQPPFRGATPLDTLRLIQESVPTPPTAVSSRVPDDLTNICLKCIDKDQQNRYATAQDLADDLSRFLSSQPVRARRASWTRRAMLFCRRHAALTATIVGAVLILVATTTLYMSHLASTNTRLSESVTELDATNKLLSSTNQELEAKRKEAEDATRQAVNERDRANEQLQRSRIRELANRAMVLKEQTPVLALLLAREAVLQSEELPNRREPVAKETLIAILSELGGTPFLQQVGYGKNTLLFDKTGKHLLTGGADNQVRIFDFNDGSPTEHAVFKAKSTISSLALHPDGSQIAVGTNSGWVHRIDFDGKEIDAAEAHSDKSCQISFSPDGSWLASAGWDGMSAVFHLANGGLGGELILHKHPRSVSGALFSPDNNRVLTTCTDHKLRWWPLTEAGVRGEPVVLEPGNNRILGSTLSPGGKWLMAIGYSRKPQVWSVDAMQPTDKPFILWGNTGQTLGADFSFTDRWVASCSMDKTIHVWDLTSDKPEEAVAKIRHGDMYASDLRFHPRDEHTFATAGADRTVRLWTTVQLNEASDRPVMKGHSFPVRVLCFSPDGNWIVSRDTRGEHRVWSTRRYSSKATRWRNAIDRTTKGLAVMPNGQYVTNGDSRKTHVWDPTTLELKATGFAKAWDSYVSTAASPDGRWIAAGSSFSTVWVWDQKTGKETRLYRRPPSESMYTLAFSADSRLLAAHCPDDRVRIWDLSTDDPVQNVREFKSEVGWVTALAFSPDGRWMLMGMQGGRVSAWKMKDGWPTDEQWLGDRHGDDVNDIEFSNDGLTMVTGGDDNDVRIWTVPTTDQDVTGFTSRVLGGHSRAVTGVAVNPTGKLVASIGSDGATLWNREPDPLRPRRLNLIAGRAVPTGVAFDRDGTTVVTTTDSGELRTWKTDTPTLLSESLSVAGRNLTDSERGRYISE